MEFDFFELLAVVISAAARATISAGLRYCFDLLREKLKELKRKRRKNPPSQDGKTDSLGN